MGSYDWPAGRKSCSTLSSPNNCIFGGYEEFPFLCPCFFMCFDFLDEKHSDEHN